jgi:hypothetical protein
MLTRLYFLIGWLTATAALGQGTFTYTFSGDNSPLNVWATFTASQQSIATGLLTETNVSSGHILQGGSQWWLYRLVCPVNSVTGQPNGAPFTTDFIAFYDTNEIDIEGGVNHDPYTKIVYYPWVGSPSNYSSSGSWSMTYSVPEPNTASLLAIGVALLWLTNQRRAVT